MEVFGLGSLRLRSTGDGAFQPIAPPTRRIKWIAVNTLRFGPQRAFNKNVKPQGRWIMKSIRIEWVVRQALCLVSVSLLAGGLLVAQQPGPRPQAAAQAPAQLLAPQQLDSMVAPVALYPDRLLGQILVAATYPLEIAEAAQWLQQNGNLQGPQLVDAARQQNWDPSIQSNNFPRCHSISLNLLNAKYLR